jgi:hypothetical protein
MKTIRITLHGTIYKITETCDGQTRSFYAIQDIEFGHWRGVSELDDYDVWTRDLNRRAEFASRQEARDELKRLWGWRRGQRSDGHLLAILFKKGRAA